ncbi:MAG TPA: RNA polymerase sigma factor [Burkholderiales bacterium]|nr:RNA polymerase sigma factor [Burkholderiales bacterium]
MGPTPDETLMLRYRDGDARAFEELYARHRGGLFRYVLRQVGFRAAADEVFQEVWMRIIAARARYRVEARFATFLYHVAHNCVMDHFRRKPPLQLLSFDDGPEEALQVPAPASEQPEKRAQRSQAARELLRALALLPDEQRDAFLLHEEGGLTLEEIAQVTGVGRETAKSRLRYALAKLRSELTGSGIEDEADVA